jgi:hypothetical protein
MTQTVVRVLLLLTLPGAALAAAPPNPQPVQLPYTFPDASGSTWDVQFDGSIGDGGNDLYDGGGRLFVSNNTTQYLSPTQHATLDPARNELTFPPMTIDRLTVSRRVAVLPALSTLRFTEILENPTDQPQTTRLRCYFNLGQAMQQSIPLEDDHHHRPDPCGYAVADPNNAVAMVTCGRASKLRPRFSARPNDDNIDIFYDNILIPPKQTVAIVHFQVRRPTADQAAEAWRTLKEKDLLADLPPDLRRRVLNFPAGDTLVGDAELLRGDDTLDVVELRNGDTCRGTLKADRFRLQTLYGPVTIPAHRVAGLVNVGAFRPTPLVATVDGEIFAGRLDTDVIPLQLTGGQLTHIPLALVTRVGYHRRSGEPDEWSFDHQPTARLRTGERLFVQRPTADLDLATPTGPIRLSPSTIASILFQGERGHIPEVRLTDGTRLSALFSANAFEVILIGGSATLCAGGPQHARLPASALTAFHFSPDPEPEPDDLAPTLTLTNGDTLVGTITGTLSLETPVDTLHVQGEQIQAITRARGGGDHDVLVTLWDHSTLGGRLTESRLMCHLKCGVTIPVPLPLLADYRQPLPAPSPAMIRRIRAIVRQLDADDWRTRDAAQAQLVAVGPPALSVLRQLRPTVPIEAAQRITQILDRLTQQLDQSTRTLPTLGTFDTSGDLVPHGPPPRIPLDQW